MDSIVLDAEDTGMGKADHVSELWGAKNLMGDT